MRHGQSEGNNDESLYTSEPDWKIGLTPVGKMQVLHSGRRLKELVGDSDVYIYHSPYLRAVQTTKLLLKVLDGKNVKVVREEPRIAEQQYGNLRDMETIARCKEERKKFGRFFYRFPDGEAGLDVYRYAINICRFIFCRSPLQSFDPFACPLQSFDPFTCPLQSFDAFACRAQARSLIKKEDMQTDEVVCMCSKSVIGRRVMFASCWCLLLFVLCTTHACTCTRTSAGTHKRKHRIRVDWTMMPLRFAVG